MSSVSSVSVYLSCEEGNSISTLDRAEVGREENKRLYGPRSNVGIQTSGEHNYSKVVGLMTREEMGNISSDSGRASEGSINDNDFEDMFKSDSSGDEE